MQRKTLLLIFFIFVQMAGLRAETPAPDTVKIGCYLISLHDFNFRDKEYAARFWVWMLYDNRKFDLERQMEVPNAKTMEKPDVLIEKLDNNIDWLQMKIKCTMKQSWSVGDYPFDKQRLKIHIENSTFDHNSLVFKPDTTGKSYDPEMAVDGWKITDFKVRTDISHYATAFGDTKAEKPESDFSRFIIEIDLARNAWGLFIKVFLGMYVAFCIAFVSFFVSIDNIEPRFGLPVGGVFASVGNKYVIDSLLPETAQLTLVDLLHGLTLICIFLMVVQSAYSLHLSSKNQQRKAIKIDKNARIGILSIFLVINILLISLAIM
jgi:hypothetical protein